LHTPPEQGVPGIAWPVCVQMGEPVEQSVAPKRQGLLCGLHAAPVAQATQLPPRHTWFVPQGVPSFTEPLAVHVCAPVEQSVAPRAQALPGGEHASPAVQATHAPLLHTMFSPHTVPSFAAVDVSTQLTPASEQSIKPLLHGAVVGEQSLPFAHAAHAPFSQYLPGAQPEPLGAFPGAPHTGMPVAHERVAAWHNPASPPQVAPAAQGEHVPSSQTAPTPPSPHAVPFGALPTGTHVEWPASPQDVTPAWQDAAMHGTPEAQPPSAPASGGCSAASDGGATSMPADASASWPTGRSPSSVEQPTAPATSAPTPAATSAMP
jgi:hypothetical protein